MRLLKPNRVLLFALLLALYSFSGLFAQSKRLAVVDVEANAVSAADQADIIESFRTALRNTPSVVILTDAEIKAGLLQPNQDKALSERRRRAHATKYAHIKSQVEKAKSQYAASSFESVTETLMRVFDDLNDASLSLEGNLISEIFELLGASYFFMGDKASSEKYFGILADYNLAATLNSEKYPPPIVDIFNDVKGAARYVPRSWRPETRNANIKFKFLGLDVVPQSYQPLELKVFSGHPFLSRFSLVVESPGYAPEVFSLNNLPNVISLAPTADQALSTRGVFAPIGRGTPSAQLQKIVERLRLDIALLAVVTKKSDGYWNIKAQWLESPTGQTSPVVDIDNLTKQGAVIATVTELRRYLSQRGSVLTRAASIASTPAPTPKPVQSAWEEGSTPFYKTWWFWTLVGVGTAGAGAGAYLLLKPSDKVRVAVEQLQ